MNQENNIPTWYSGIVLFSVAAALGVVAAAKHQASAPFARHWRAFVASGTTFVLATVGMKMVGASLSAAGGRFTPGFMVLVTIEEVAEMASIGLFLCAVIDYAASAVGTVLIRIPAMSRDRS